MEIVGLAIVVVLISIGLLLLIKFRVNSGDTPDPKKNYENAELASNTLYSLVRISTNNCKPGTTMTTLLQDCAKDKEIRCTQPGFENKDSCYFANQTISFILNATLNQWEKSYMLYFDQLPYTYENKNCTQDSVSEERYKNIDTKMFPLPLYPGTLIAYLSICST